VEAYHDKSFGGTDGWRGARLRRAGERKGPESERG